MINRMQTLPSFCPSRFVLETLDRGSHLRCCCCWCCCGAAAAALPVPRRTRTEPRCRWRSRVAPEPHVGFARSERAFADDVPRVCAPTTFRAPARRQPSRISHLSASVICACLCASLLYVRKSGVSDSGDATLKFAGEGRWASGDLRRKRTHCVSLGTRFFTCAVRPLPATLFSVCLSPPPDSLPRWLT